MLFEWVYECYRRGLSTLARVRGAGTRCFAFIKARLCGRCLSHLAPAPLMLVRTALAFARDLIDPHLAETELDETAAKLTAED